MSVIVKTVQHFGFFATQLCNFVLLYLIFTRASLMFGTYKYLMVTFSMFSLMYSYVEMATQPVIHEYKTCMFMYSDGFFKNDITISTRMAEIYCASFALCVSFLTNLFIYRYIAVCRPLDLHNIEGVRVTKLFVIPFSFFLFWWLCVYFSFAPSSLKSEFMREVIQENYQEDTFHLGYIAILYYYPNPYPSKSVTFRWSDFFGVLGCCGIMQSCILTMVICGRKTFKRMQKVGEMSRKTRDLNKQLFRTLILQTLVPMCTMFLPVATDIVIPIFSVTLGKLANLASLYAGIYPALDALIAIFMIKDFRNAVLCRTKKTSLGSTTGGSSITT